MKTKKPKSKGKSLAAVPLSEYEALDFCYQLWHMAAEKSESQYCREGDSGNFSGIAYFEVCKDDQRRPQYLPRLIKIEIDVFLNLQAASSMPGRTPRTIQLWMKQSLPHIRRLFGGKGASILLKDLQEFMRDHGFDSYGDLSGSEWW